MRLHKETVLFGLTLRQLLCSGLAVGTAVMVYLALGPVLGKETASWVCILAAAPFAVAGFFQYNGLTFGQFLWAVLKSQVLYAGPRVFRQRTFIVLPCPERGSPMIRKTADLMICSY